MDPRLRNSMQAGQATSAAPRDRTRLEGLVDKVDEQLTALHETNIRLGRVADKLMGTTPQGISGNKPDEEPQSLLGRLENLLGNIDMQLALMRTSADRLESV